MGLPEGEVSKGANSVVDDCGYSECRQVRSHQHLVSARACFDYSRCHLKHILENTVEFSPAFHVNGIINHPE